jgi:hypothetical protein
MNQLSKAAGLLAWSIGFVLIAFVFMVSGGKVPFILAFALANGFAFQAAGHIIDAGRKGIKGSDRAVSTLIVECIIGIVNLGVALLYLLVMALSGRELGFFLIFWTLASVLYFFPGIVFLIYPLKEKNNPSP